MARKYPTRRDFIKYSGVVAGSGILAACGGSGSSTGTPPAPPGPGPGPNPTPPPVGELRITPQDKALVFILLAGGNDSYNMLVPISAAYSDYKTSRSNLALDKNSLLPLNGYTDADGNSFGLHPSMPNVQRLFGDKKLSFVANCGPLVEPTSKAQYFDNNVKLPVGLMSHADQIRHWQTGEPGQRVKTGWFGKFADVMQKGKSDQQIGMGISLAGTNIAQNGSDSLAYAIGASGSSGLIVKENDPSFGPGQRHLNQALLNGFNTVLDRDYGDPFKNTYVEMMRHAQSHHEAFSGATESIQPSTQFSDSDLSQQLKMVARSIAAAKNLGMHQQTFFVQYGGWDHHDELLVNHERMLKVLDNALGEFQQSLDELNIADRVVTFTASDFGRTLTSNGNGTDHGWGGNMMVMGEAVKGGEVFGEFPSLALGNDLDIGNGLLIPTTASDEVFTELSMWFGVEKAGMQNLFPNVSKFYDLNSSTPPLGIIA
jgi:uncharacterized protein (DUF1501 family)